MWKEEAMPHEPASAFQLDRFLSDAQAYRDALARYEVIRPIFKRERTLAQQSRITGLSYWRLWRDLRRFRRAGLLGLIDRRTLPHRRGRPPIDMRLPRDIQQHIIRLAMAHPFTARELARIVRDCYHQPIDYRGSQRVLAQHRLSPAALQRHHQVALQASLPSSLPTQQLTFPTEGVGKDPPLGVELDGFFCNRPACSMCFRHWLLRWRMAGFEELRIFLSAVRREPVDVKKLCQGAFVEAASSRRGMKRRSWFSGSRKRNIWLSNVAQSELNACADMQGMCTRDPSCPASIFAGMLSPGFSSHSSNQTRTLSARNHFATARTTALSFEL
jgi:hypothetical protein